MRLIAKASFLLALTLGISASETHVTVYREKGRFGGWPANHGIWSWGDEVVVGFSAAWYMDRGPDRHPMDPSKPEEPRLGRSLDGGATWTVEAPRSLLPPEQGGKRASRLPAPMDFTHPDFAMTIRFRDVNTGSSLFWYSTNRGREWNGPFEFPLFGQKGVAARTDYIVNGPRDCLVFLSAAKSNGKEGRPFAARTLDGGMSWKFVSWIGPEPAGFAIMPSTVRTGPRGLLSTVRVKQDAAHNWIDAWASEDDGASWKLTGKAIADTGEFSGTPPSLIRLRDGRLCLTYGVRAKPYRIATRLSPDNGRTWSAERILRGDGVAWDVGYVRSAERPDGKVVSVYYFNDKKAPERFVAATIWQP
jgi:hypothetical protein